MWVIFFKNGIRCAVGLPTWFWKIGDLGVEPRRVQLGEGRVLNRIYCHTVHPPKWPLSLFCRGTDLCCLKMSCNSGRSPPSTWRLAILICSQEWYNLPPPFRILSSPVSSAAHKPGLNHINECGFMKKGAVHCFGRKNHSRPYKRNTRVLLFSSVAIRWRPFLFHLVFPRWPFLPALCVNCCFYVSGCVF